jgi:hypothetical protein
MWTYLHTCAAGWGAMANHFHGKRTKSQLASGVGLAVRFAVTYLKYLLGSVPGGHRPKGSLSSPNESLEPTVPQPPHRSQTLIRPDGPQHYRKRYECEHVGHTRLAST